MRQILSALCPFLSPRQLEQFDLYARLLGSWNEKVNLTAITEPAEVAKKHFADSLAALPLLADRARVIDVGTGAGFPGVPLLIANPTLQMTLLDGLNKRIAFLQTLLPELGLSAECVHLRAEEAGQNPLYRGKFDFAVTRAVAALPVLAELTVPLLKVGGKSVAYKGDAAAELAESRGALHLLHADADVTRVPADYGARSLVVITKKEPTPKAYPRRPGMPGKNPL